MAMDFPNSPTVNQTFTVGDKTWKWTGSAWEIVVNRPATRTVADTAPSSPMVGDEWFNSTTGRTYTWYDSYWVEVNTNSMVGASGLNGVASASAPLVYNNTNNNISVQTNPSFAGNVTLNNGRLLVKSAGSGDPSGVIELYSYDGAINYIYKANGGGITFGTQSNTVMNYNNSGHRSEGSQPVWQSDITVPNNAGNVYLTINSSIRTNIGFTVTDSSTITVQTAGKYLVIAKQLITSGGSNYYHIQKNNVTIHHGWTNNIMIDYGAHCLIDCAANDTIRLYLANAINGYWNGVHSSLSIVKVA